MRLRNLSLLVLLLISFELKAQVYEYECQKGTEVWEYFNKVDGITDESFIITFDTENILFETSTDNFYYSINAVDKKILEILKDKSKRRGTKT